MGATELDVIRAALDLGIKQAAIARILKRDRASVSRAIARMERDGTLEARPLPFDLAELVAEARRVQG